MPSPYEVRAQYRKWAFAFTGGFALCIAAYFGYRFVGIIQNRHHPPTKTSEQTNWGPLPDLAICNTIPYSLTGFNATNYRWQLIGPWKKSDCTTVTGWGSNDGIAAKVGWCDGPCPPSVNCVIGKFVHMPKKECVHFEFPTLTPDFSEFDFNTPFVYQAGYPTLKISTYWSPRRDDYGRRSNHFALVSNGLTKDEYKLHLDQILLDKGTWTKDFENIQRFRRPAEPKEHREQVTVVEMQKLRIPKGDAVLFDSSETEVLQVSYRGAELKTRISTMEPGIPLDLTIQFIKGTVTQITRMGLLEQIFDLISSLGGLFSVFSIMFYLVFVKAEPDPDRSLRVLKCSQPSNPGDDPSDDESEGEYLEVGNPTA